MQQVIYLEVEDDMPAVRDMLEGAQAKQVLLVVPKGSITFHNSINLRILRRLASNLALDVALVTRDGRTRQMAKEEGIPTLRSISRGRRGRWRLRAPRRSAAERAAEARVDGLREGRGDVGYSDRLIVWAGRALGLVLFVVLLAVVLALAALLIPEAKVTLVPYRQDVTTVLELRADPEVEKPDLEDLTIPARLLEAQVEQVGEIATVARRDAPDAPAVGTISLINETAAPQEILPGVIVRTSTGTTVRFKTTTTATVPAGIGSRAEAQIEALEPGPVGNVPAATINTVETASLRGKVRVINAAPTSGGGVKQVGVVTRADMDRLHAQLLQQLQQRAYLELQSQLGEQEFLPPESMTIEILAEVYDQFLDAEADVLKLQLRILAIGTAVDKANANLLAYESLQEQIPGTYELRSEEIMFNVDEENVRMDGRSVILEAEALAPLIVDINKGEVRDAVIGLTEQEAAQVLADSFSLSAPPIVEIEPDWVKRWEQLDKVPRTAFRIQVIVLE
jgi:hypothetical protein